MPSDRAFLFFSFLLAGQRFQTSRVLICPSPTLQALTAVLVELGLVKNSRIETVTTNPDPHPPLDLVGMVGPIWGCTVTLSVVSSSCVHNIAACFFQSCQVSHGKQPSALGSGKSQVYGRCTSTWESGSWGGLRVIRTSTLTSTRNTQRHGKGEAALSWAEAGEEEGERGGSEARAANYQEHASRAIY